MAHQTPQQTQESADAGRGGTVSNLERDGAPVGCKPIAGLKAGWFFRPADRMILHRSRQDGPALPIGTVPVVLGRVTYRMSDRRHTRIAYQIMTETGPRIVSSEEVLDGTWADRAGMRRPTTPDERHAYARILGEDVMTAEEIPALPVKDDRGGLELPDPDAQELGYLRTREPDQQAAREAWSRVMSLATQAPRTTLALSAMFSGPLVSSLHGVPAHILNLTGHGQLGKSTAQRIMCALMGDPDESTGELFGSMNATGLYLPELLIEARYLPMCREETSSSALSLPELEKLFSRIVAGARRGRLGQGGTRKQAAGTWHSVFITSSNESLLRHGQVEALASRLVQLQAPFFASAAASAEAWDLASRHHGWPLVWARDNCMFTSERVAEWRRLHGEIVERLTTEEARESGGIPLTIARILGAWCVGAYMLAELLGMPELGAVAEEDARAELPRILGDVTETHLTPGQVLWEAVAGAIAQEPASWVPATALASDTWNAAFDVKPRRVLGYYHQDRVHVYVSTLKEVARAAGIDTPVPGLKELHRRGVLITQERAKLACKHPTRELRDAVPGRVYVFDPRAAQTAFADRETPPDITPSSPGLPGEDSATVAAERRAVEAYRNPAAVQAQGVDAAASRRRDVTTTIQAPPKPTHPPRVVFPEAAERVTDRSWASLADRATGRTRAAMRVGVLGAARLYLPNREPVQVPMPGSVDDVPALMAAYGLKTLWIHQEGLAPLGLPSYEERRQLGAAQERAAQGLGPDDPVRMPGPMTPVAHPWAQPSEGSTVAEVAPAGLTAWMTLKLADGATGTTGTGDRRLSVAIPAYEDRFDKAKQLGRGGWGGAETPDVLLDAVMVWTLSTLHGTHKRPTVVPYYLSPNRTGEDLAGGRERTDVACRAVREKAVPPALGVRLCPLLVPQQWHRDPTEAERRAGWLHRYDKTAAWLAAYGSTKLGIGEPTHGREGTLYNKSMAGFWRVADVPGRGIQGLPELNFREVEEGGFWLTTPSVELLRELYPDWMPRVLESWHWETSKAALSGMYKLMSTSRNRILGAAEEGRPGAKWAKQVNGRIYQSFRGYLARAAGPQTDHTTGGTYDKDVYYRPDWAAMLISQATANAYRNLAKFAREDGRYPLSVYVDAVTYTSDDPDPLTAKPASMVIGTKGGTWSAEGSAPMTEVLPLLDDPDTRHGAHTALDQYLTEKED